MIQADIAVIGAGPGGYVAAIKAAQLGANVVCIEKEHIGGVCLNWGCIPTKALLRSAEVLETVRHASQFGVQAGEVSFDWATAQARRRQVVSQMVDGVKLLLARAGVTVVEGTAQLVREGTLVVESAVHGQDTIQAESIIIATGSRTMKAPIPGLDDPGVIDSTGALSLEELPESICIIGSGAIGVEFASLFNTFGVEVTLVEMLPRITPLMDESISAGLEWSLGAKGVDIRTGARVTQVERLESGYRISMETEDGPDTVTAERVMSAIGRSPNIENLGLEKVGISPSRKGIQVDNRMRTVAPGIYAIGDVANAGPMLAHVASHQGVVAVEDALGHTASIDYAQVPACIYSIPEAASVGLTEAQARESGEEIATGTFALANNGKAVAMGETDGFVKVIAAAGSGALLGLHVVGPHASDLVLEGTLGLGLEVTLDELERTIHPHPALGEAVAEAVLAVRKRAIHLPAS